MTGLRKIYSLKATNFLKFDKIKILFEKIIYPFFFLLMILFYSSCQKEPIPEIEPEAYNPYTFFVAGHVYGSPGTDNVGFHPPFREKFDLINKRNTSIGFLLGDIVNVSTEKNWNEVDSVLQYLENETFFAAGNHDITDRQLYETRYGRTYFSFIHEHDLFIVLDPNIDGWNISGDQMGFLIDVLDKQSSLTRNIFVLFHQLLWIDKNNKYKNVRPNSFEGKAETINFWTEVMPLFEELNKNVYMFAGDVGAAYWSDDLMYDTFNNITFVATGMGEEIGDNFVFVDIDETGNVSFELITLNGDDIHAMGKLEDYIIP